MHRVRAGGLRGRQDRVSVQVTRRAGGADAHTAASTAKHVRRVPVDLNRSGQSKAQRAAPRMIRKDDLTGSRSGRAARERDVTGDVKCGKRPVPVPTLTGVSSRSRFGTRRCPSTAGRVEIVPRANAACRSATVGASRTGERIQTRDRSRPDCAVPTWRTLKRLRVLERELQRRPRIRQTRLPHSPWGDRFRAVCGPRCRRTAPGSRRSPPGRPRAAVVRRVDLQAGATTAAVVMLEAADRSGRPDA
jgi:hypothetical protein